MSSSNNLTRQEVVKQLEELTLGLFYMSESDYPLEVVVLDQVADYDLTPTTILAFTGQTAATQVQEQTLPYFFRNMTKERDDADSEAQNSAERFRLLQHFMEQHLEDVKVYRIGKREIKALVLGKTTDNFYAGFKTTVVET